MAKINTTKKNPPNHSISWHTLVLCLDSENSQRIISETEKKYQY